MMRKILRVVMVMMKIARGDGDGGGGDCGGEADDDDNAYLQDPVSNRHHILIYQGVS